MAAKTMLSFEAASKSDTAGMEEYKCFDVVLDSNCVVNCNIVTMTVVISTGHSCN